MCRTVVRFSETVFELHSKHRFLPYFLDPFYAWRNFIRGSYHNQEIWSRAIASSSTEWKIITIEAISSKQNGANGNPASKQNG